MADTRRAGRAGAAPGRLPAGRTTTLLRTAVRTLLLTVPGQLLGVLVAGVLLQAGGVMSASSSWAILVVAGLVPGTALGLLLAPGPRQRRTAVTTVAVVATAVALILISIARRSGPGGELGWGPALAGVAVVGVTQTVTAWLLWSRRGRRA